MHASEVTPEAARLANELYWSSDQSVNQIADELDLSKGALYGVIAPQSSGLCCPMCADEVVFPNRTAKERDLLQCPTCEWEGGSAETVDYESAGPGSAVEDGGAPAIVDPAPVSRRSKGPARPRRGKKSAKRDDDEIPRPRTESPADEHPGTDMTEVEGDDSAALTPLLTPRMRTIAGGALIGAAVGLVLVAWARRR